MGNEIFPMEFRAKAVAVCSACSLGGNYVMGQITPLLMDSMGFRTFLLFCIVDVLCFVYASWIPETANVHLEQLVLTFEQKLRIKNADRAGETESMSPET